MPKQRVALVLRSGRGDDKQTQFTLATKEMLSESIKLAAAEIGLKLAGKAKVDAALLAAKYSDKDAAVKAADAAGFDAVPYQTILSKSKRADAKKPDPKKPDPKKTDAKKPDKARTARAGV